MYLSCSYFRNVNLYLFIETPKDLQLQSATWSDYKHHNTMKLLVACTPNSSTGYVSPAYTGRISDKALTVDCGYLDNIPPLFFDNGRQRVRHR